MADFFERLVSMRMAIFVRMGEERLFPVGFFYVVFGAGCAHRFKVEDGVKGGDSTFANADDSGFLVWREVARWAGVGAGCFGGHESVCRGERMDVTLFVGGYLYMTRLGERCW